MNENTLVEIPEARLQEAHQLYDQALAEQDREMHKNDPDPDYTTN